MNRFSISEQFLKNHQPSFIGVLIYPNVEAMDVVGTMEVFAFANIVLQNENLVDDPVYKIQLISRKATPVKTLSVMSVSRQTSIVHVSAA